MRVELLNFVGVLIFHIEEVTELSDLSDAFPPVICIERYNLSVAFISESEYMTVDNVLNNKVLANAIRKDHHKRIIRIAN